ncbi:unnamed protein product [Rotaria sordida]|uniref:Uncharacterized protein n=1 Tax=Rotaria sordida TaxID=392033 RepID=A0A818VZW0_9BILA|nr:unnamed protein product [Rotaria sordida]CAF1206546.1 unnamed protein product [Rotaria sordida]CAF1347840.1 unnamed protein product [Rotaria sordida]CAF3717962.1 unnamed protein product [Rotaria sordida]CAF3792461.1 unnamed protein product [Rotaria sordida]
MIGTIPVHVISVFVVHVLKNFIVEQQKIVCSPESRLNQTIPSLVVGYLLVDSLLASSFECFYNASCIQILIEWYSFESHNATIDPCVLNVTTLDPTVDDRFFLDTTLNNIVSQLFIED